MHLTREQIEHEAQNLPRDERARLAEALLASLDEEARIEQAWLAEAGRRAAEIDAGTVTTLSADEVLADLDAIVSE